MSIFSLLFSVVLSTRAQTVEPTPKSGGIVLHLALVQSIREHINFEIAQSRLKLANPDRRIITRVRKRDYSNVNGLPKNLSILALDKALHELLPTLDRPIELVYVQMNDFAYMQETWREFAAGATEPTSNPILSLRGYLAPDAKIVVIGQNFLGLRQPEFAGHAKELLEYLGAPQGSLIAQITPTILPYENTDFAKNPGRRLAAATVKGFGAAALHQLGVGELGLSDAFTLPLVAAGAGALYHRTLPKPASPDTEVKPKMFPFFTNIDDVLFTAAIAVGTSALAHGYFHIGTSFLNEAYLKHGVIATGVFFALSLLPKFAHNLHVTYLERTRVRNSVNLYSTVEQAIAPSMHANDPRTFRCDRTLAATAL